MFEKHNPNSGETTPMAHPLSTMNPYAHETGAYDMSAGDRICLKSDGREGVADEFLSDGDAFVSFDDGTFGTVRWNDLQKIA